MINFNAELWNIHQICVLKVLNTNEANPARKEEKNWLIKVEMSRHKFKMS